MADLVVNTGLLNDRGSEFDRISKKIKTIAAETDSTFKSLDLGGQITVALSRNSRNFKAAINSSASSAAKLSGALKNAARLYAAADKNVGDKKFGAAKKKKKSGLNFLDFEIFEKLGTFGDGYGVVRKLSDGIKKVQAGSWALGLKDIISSGDGLYKAFKTARDGDKAIALFKKLKLSKGENIAYWWKNALGMRDYFDVNDLGSASKLGSLGARWSENLTKVAGKELKRSSVLVGTLIAGVCNGLSNYDKYKSGKISANKAVKKTIVQTTLDVALDKGLKIAVTAGMAAVCGGAPVIAVAASTFIIKKGLDAATKSLTGGKYDGLTDFASDKIVDGIDAYVDIRKAEFKTVAGVLINCDKKLKKGVSALWRLAA